MELKDSQGIFNKPVNVSVTARLAEILSLHCIKMMQKKTFTQTHEAALFRIISHLCLLITSNHAMFPSLCLASFVFQLAERFRNLRTARLVLLNDFLTL